MSLTVVPMTLGEANAFVERHHRHHQPVPGHKFSIGVAEGDRIVGVCIVGWPKARMLHNGLTLEVNRVATDGTRNACSMLYGAAWRAAKALGYKKVITYTLPEEGGGIASRFRLAPNRRSRRGILVAQVAPNCRSAPATSEAEVGGGLAQ